MRKLGKARRQGVEMALVVAEKRLAVCAASNSEWQVKYKRGECELISWSTENSAMREAVVIVEQIKLLLA